MTSSTNVWVVPEATDSLAVMCGCQDAGMPGLIVGGIGQVVRAVEPPAASASATTGSSRLVVQSGPAFVVIEYAWIETQPHYHSPADHHDLVQLGTEYAVIVVAVLVAGSLVMRSFVSRIG